MTPSSSATGYGATSTGDATHSIARSALTRALEARWRMRDGRRFILTGFVIAVIGIISYCIVGLGAPTQEGDVATFGSHVVPSLCIIGLGTLLWLIGSIRFLGGAMDSNDDVIDLDL